LPSVDLSGGGLHRRPLFLIFCEVAMINGWGQQQTNVRHVPHYGDVPNPAAPNVMASLSPPDLTQYAQQNQWARHQVFYPELILPQGANIGIQMRRRTLTLANWVAGAPSIQQLQFDKPATVYALSAAAVSVSPLGSSNAFAGLDARDFFTVQMERANGDRLDTGAIIASASFGDARFPALVGGPGWMFDRGGSMQVTITPLVTLATARLDVVFWTMEISGPANFTVGG